MKKTLSIILAKTGSFLIRISRKIYFSPFLANKNSFKNKIGDSSNFDFDLGENSIVFDAGGYMGQWSSDVYSKYNCKIHIFEPVPKFAEIIKKRFSLNKKIAVKECGLSNKNEQSTIFLSDDGSSTINNSGGENVSVCMVDIVGYMESSKIEMVDFLKLNIEGGEYDVLDRLINCNQIKKIGGILIQFHDFFPNAKSHMKNIREKLANTHAPEYQFDFVWELWKPKK
jgi:FkbM family methyltransferase